MTGDRGIFVSVAERLIAGDILYVTVWDNKDPLFFYSLAAGRMASPYLDIAIELAWFAAAAVAGFAIARNLGLSFGMALVTGAGGVPLVLAGGEYLAGFTHLPGSVLTIATLAVGLRRRYVLMGILVVVLGLFKLVMLPLGIAVGVTVLLLRRDRAAVIRTAIGLISATVAGLVLLAIRGEFTGYFQQVAGNVFYAGGNSYMDPSVNPFIKRLEFTLTASATVTLLATIAALAISFRLLPNSDASQPLVITRIATLTSVVLAFAIIAATGLREHHAQVLYAPAALSLLLFIASIVPLRELTLSSIIAGAALAGVLAGGVAPQLAVMGLQGSLTQARSLSEQSAASKALVDRAESSSYARLGDNTDDAHAVGLRDWTLACPRFAQYGTDGPAVRDEMLACLPGAQYVIVDEKFAPIEVGAYGYGVIGSFDNWNSLVSDLTTYVDKNYDCLDIPDGRLCERTS